MKIWGETIMYYDLYNHLVTLFQFSDHWLFCKSICLRKRSGCLKPSPHCSGLGTSRVLMVKLAICRYFWCTISRLVFVEGRLQGQRHSVSKVTHRTQGAERDRVPHSQPQLSLPRESEKSGRNDTATSRNKTAVTANSHMGSGFQNSPQGSLVEHNW